MARTGRFGRTPRSAPSLTSTLVAIAREYQNQRAQNIMDAWQKGGMFEGKKATDEVVLKFWKDKAAGVSKDDPLYDTYHNAQTQLDYTIHESKMTAQYALSKKTPADDARMVSFYLNWAKKVPKDSEFYRVLQRDAGQYMRVQRANGEAEARRRKEELYQRQQAATQKQKEAAGEFAIDTFRRMAQSGNASLGLAPAIAGPGSGSDLTEFDENDPDLMLRLVAAITTEGTELGGRNGREAIGSGEFSGSDTVLYHDDDGKPVTGKDVIKKFQSLDPSYKPGTPFTVSYATGLLDRQMQGLNERIARAKATGHMSDVSSLLKSKGYVATLNREIAAYPVQKAYQEARADYDAIVSDRTASPQAKLNAWQEYSSTLTKLANDPRIEADDNTRARLVAEVRGDDGVPSMHESFTGLANGQFDPGSATDNKKNREAIEFMQSQVDAVNASAALPPSDPNKAVWTYGELDSNGVFTPKAGGRTIGAATTQAVQAGGENAQTVTVPDPRGGTPLTMSVTAVPIYATAKDPVTGEPLPGTNNQPIGWAYDMPKGTGSTTKYMFTTKDGPIFTSDPLWGGNAGVTNSSKGGNHIEVDFSDDVAKSLGFSDKDPVTGQYRTAPANLNVDANTSNGIHVRANYETDANGNPKHPTIAFDPQDMAWKSGTRGALGTPDPITDFRSLTLATLMDDEEGRSILSNLDKNPEFKTTLGDDAYRFAGAQLDGKTGTWVPGTGDQTKLGQALGQTALAASTSSFGQYVNDAAATFTRLTTGSPAGRADSTTPDAPLMKLATDLVQGTAFQALASVFHPGTSTIKPPQSGDLANGFAIKPVSVIKAPTLPPMTVYTPPVIGPTAAPTAAQTPTQTGSVAPTTTQQGSTAPSSSGGGRKNYAL